MRDLASALRSVRPLVSIRFFYYCYCYCLPDIPANTCWNRVIVSPTMPHSGLFLPSFSRRGHGQATSHTRCFPTTHRLELGDSAGNPSLLPVISRCPPLPSTLEACPQEMTPSFAVTSQDDKDKRWVPDGWVGRRRKRTQPGAQAGAPVSCLDA